MNAAWHAEHPMPRHASLEQRVRWHAEHAAACGCRRPPADIAAILAGRRAAPPDQENY
jgi:hypothetical protein